MSNFIFNPLHSEELQLYPEAGEFDSRYLKLDQTTPQIITDGAPIFDGGLKTRVINAKDATGLSLFDDANNGIFVRDGGNVGIGTTAPGAKLDVAGAVRLGDAGGTYDILNTSAAGGAASGDLYWGNSALLTSASIGSFGVSSVTNSDGTLNISPTTGDVVASLNLANANTWTGLQTFQANLATNQINAIDSSGLGLYDDGGNGIFVADGGNVGIGTNSPTEKLEVERGHIRFNQVTKPGAATASVLATSGNLNGTYMYKITFVTPEGETEWGTVSNTVSPVNQQVQISNIPISSSPDVIARRIYRSSGGSAVYYYGLLDTINDNSTTSYIDNNASISSTRLSLVNSTGGGYYIGTTKVMQFTETGNLMIGGDRILFDDPLDNYYQIGRNVAGFGMGIRNASTNMTVQSYGELQLRSIGSYVQILTQSGEAIRVDATRNVGIGTTAPDTKLHIGAGAMTLEAMTAPSSPASDKAVLFLEATGTSPSRTVALKVKWEDGSTSTLASVTV